LLETFFGILCLFVLDIYCCYLLIFHPWYFHLNFLYFLFLSPLPIVFVFYTINKKEKFSRC
jgi:hypothetical protein